MARIIGAGLVALDIVVKGKSNTPLGFAVGGSCGNVMSILSYLSWESYPIARLGKDKAAEIIFDDLQRSKVCTKFISTDNSGSTPVILHRISKDRNGLPIHKFEFREPATRAWFPQFKAITKSIASAITQQHIVPNVFYFDRVNPGTLDLAAYYRSIGVLIFFEPSSDKDEKAFSKALSLADIVKFSSERVSDYKEKYPQPQCLLEIETLGKDGLNIRSAMDQTARAWTRLEGFPSSELIDAAGAGDWCSSGIICKLCSSGKNEFRKLSFDDISRGVEYGQAMAAIACLTEGARGPMYVMNVERYLELVDFVVAGGILAALEIDSCLEESKENIELITFA